MSSSPICCVGVALMSSLTTREAQQLGRNDADQLAYATAAQRAFVTHNRADFEALG